VRRKVFFVITAALLSSLYGNNLNAAEIMLSETSTNEMSSEDDQASPPAPFEDLEGEANDTASASEEINDPLEPLNRCILVFNQMIDGLILRPASVVYKTALPEPVRESISNVLSNLWGPVSFANYLLQGDPKEAGAVLGRFTINSTLGLGGIIDVAEKMDISGKNTGFADTLMVWGIDSGPYLMLPVLGPSTFRGTAGLAADYYSDPFNYYLTHKKRKHKRRWIVYTRTGVEIIDQRHRLLDTIDDLEANSVDFYAAVRSIHFQSLDYKKKQRQHK